MLLNGLPDSCAGCKLSTNPHSGYFTKVTGDGHSGVLIIGEASGEAEARMATAFVDSAPAGSILEKAIRMSGGQRKDYWITNIIRCRPPNNILSGAPYERDAIHHCSGNLDRAIREYNPGAILALGSIPLRELTGRSGGKQSISYLRGYCLPGPNGIPTIPSFHPAFIVRGYTSRIGLLIKDLATARSAAAGRLTYVVDPSTEMMAFEGVKALEDLYEEAKGDPQVWIAYDIETKESLEGEEDELVEFERTTDDLTDDGTHSAFDEGDAGQLGLGEDLDRLREEAGDKGGNGVGNKLGILSGGITSIQFAISDQWGVYGDWRDPRIKSLAQKILELPNPKVAHNGDHFDRPVLERDGIHIEGDNFDSLSMRKALQPDLPAGLQQVAVDYGWRWPWKHYSGTNAVLYGVADVCSLVRIVSKLPDELDRLGMWEGYQRYIREVRAKVEIPWEKRGIPMSVEKLDELRECLTTEVEIKTEVVISTVPDELHQMHPPEGYKNLPDSIKEYVLEKHKSLFDPVPKTLKNGTTKYYKSKVKNLDIYHMLVKDELEGTLAEVLSNNLELKRGMFGDGLEYRLYEHIPFNPRSSQQMIKYLKHMKYEVPVDFKKGTETTSDKLMKRLEEKTQDPIIKLSREIRAFEKMRDSYTGKIKDGVAVGGWIPDTDGRLRVPTMTNSTWQYSSVGVNVFTLPKRREELAKRFRKCVAAEPGHVLVEMDFKSFHDLTTASLATDEVKWRTARLDGHSYTAGHLVKYPGIHKALEMNDSDLKMYLDEIKGKHKKVRNEQAKPLNHGTNFGQGYRRLYFENEEYFESELQAKNMLLMLKRIYPKTFKWQEQLLESLDVGAGRVPYLQSVWGSRRWFWDVWSWKKNKFDQWYKSKGQDAEKALAFLPANNAHGMFRKKLLEASEKEWLHRYELILFPHDAWIFHPPIELADECIENIKSLMEAPVIELANPILCPEGLSCSVDVAIGPSMGEMEEIH